MKLTIYNYICFFVFGYFFSYSSSCCAFVADDVNHRLEVLIARKSIMGRVVDGDGVPLPGATVLEKGTSNGAVTDLEGKFALTVADDAVLRFSFMGYKTQEVSVKGHTFLDIVLEEDAVELDKVVVTALGIEKKEHSLSYAMSQVKSEELTRVKMPNLITSLTGKTAGVQVNQVSSGLGASAKVNIRGIRSVAGENQPLYVIDGVPMLNSTSEQAFSAIGGTANAGNRDGGDGISNLNSEDIESISILKGAPAAALYGSQAGNGVILITTKKGKSQGQRSISFSTSLMFDKASSLPEMQNRYGVSDGVDSWGERKDLPKYDNLNDFFSTGVTSITSVSVSHGNEKLQNYFSYANTTGKGIIDKNRLSKHNITFIVLARYMQVISEQMINAYPNKIINIHHSFLPAFVGAKPYHAAFQRGVKIIGATSHYVTTELDAGPIIEQDVVRITHKDAIEDLVNKGKDLEKIVLSRAVQKHIERKVLTYKNKTVIFS